MLDFGSETVNIVAAKVGVGMTRQHVLGAFLPGGTGTASQHQHQLVA